MIITSICNSVHGDATRIDLHDRCCTVSSSSSSEGPLKWLLPAAVINCQVRRMVHGLAEGDERRIASRCPRFIHTEVGGRIGRQVSVYAFAQIRACRPRLTSE